jgi:hypothetical protein
VLIERGSSDQVASCVACNTTFDEPAWSALHTVELLYRHQLRDLLSEWPWADDAYLEVRACRCGGTVARLLR